MKPVHALLLALLGSTLSGGGASAKPAPADDEAEWLAYKLKFGKSYERPEDDAAHFRQFLVSREQVRRNAADASATFRLELNRFADYLPREAAALTGLRAGQLAKNQATGASNAAARLEEQKFLDDILNDARPVPERLDWRQVANRVGAVRNQNQCGACWAEATVGMLEGQQAVRNVTAGEIIPLSVQNLVDCPAGRRGCGGGSAQEALAEIAQQGGVMSEMDYPYASLNDDKCWFDKDKAVMSAAGPVVVPGDEELLKTVVARYGPVVTYVNFFSLQLYANGTASCPPAEAENHAVVIVGYGTSPEGLDYWIVKNSWGEQWGLGGYVHLLRGVHSCLIGLTSVIARF